MCCMGFIALLIFDCVLHGFFSWRFHPTKAKAWAEDFQKAIDEDNLPPALASKFCGRVAFLNSTVFNRLGRALVRPLIWRQLQRCGQTTLTKRLRAALRWFVAVLKANLCRRIPYAFNVSSIGFPLEPEL